MTGSVYFTHSPKGAWDNGRGFQALKILLLVFSFSYVTQSASVSSSGVPMVANDNRNALGTDELLRLRGDWMTWKMRHNKDYLTAEEESRRFLVWADNLMFIEDHNSKKAEYGYSLDMNVFGDQTFQDWGDLYKCHKFESGDTDAYSVFSSSSTHQRRRDAAEYVDWRSKGVVTQVKSQEDYRCHSCYAFAATGALESAHALATRQLVSLSEQQLLDCSKTYSNAGCQGGNYKDSWKYITKNGGIDTSSSYPYKSQAGACSYDIDYIGAKMSDIKVIEQGDEEALGVAVEEIGPVAVTMDHLHRPFQFYREGIYSYCGCSANPKNATHEMLAVGFGSDSNYGKYWILKNSYGTTWGIDGYMYVLRGVNTCGVASDAGFPVI